MPVSLANHLYLMCRLRFCWFWTFDFRPAEVGLGRKISRGQKNHDPAGTPPNKTMTLTGEFIADLLQWLYEKLFCSRDSAGDVDECDIEGAQLVAYSGPADEIFVPVSEEFMADMERRMREMREESERRRSKPCGDVLAVD